MEYGYDVPLLLNMQPAGKYLGERFHRAGGVPAIMWELEQQGLLRSKRPTVTGKPPWPRTWSRAGKPTTAK
jgi:dihydroxyacid dehydratase/phosphogluconate dehydratase